ncbi:MAG: hypothetical protein AAF667_15290 [Pseudomonadota bacterium]
MHLLAIRPWALIAAFLFVAACDPFISPYNEQAYRNATELKARSLDLVARSGEPYSRYSDEVADLALDVNAAYEYAAGLPDNRVVTNQWNILRDPDGNLLGGFITQWRESGTLSSFFREELSGQIAEGFDQIICVEANKGRATRCE